MSTNNRFIILEDPPSDFELSLDDLIFILDSDNEDCDEAFRFTLRQVFTQFGEFINSAIPVGAVEINHLSRDARNFIIRAGQEVAEGDTDETPTTPPPSTMLPTSLPGLVPPPEIVPIENRYEPVQPDTIPVQSPSPRINPPSPVTKPVTYHPSQPQNLSIVEGHETLLANWQDVLDDGNSAVIRFEVAIKLSTDTTTIPNLTWIDKGLTYSHLFENLENNTEYIIYVRAVNAVGVSFSTEERAQPNVVPSKPLTLTIVPKVGYFTYDHIAGIYNPVEFQLTYSESVGTINSNLVTAAGGTIASTSGTNNVFVVTVTPNNFTTPITLTVAVDAAKTSVDKKIAAAVTSAPVSYRARLALPNVPHNVQKVVGDKSVELTWELPTGLLEEDEAVISYQVSLDTVDWTNIPAGVFSHTITGLVNDVTIVVYIRSYNPVTGNYSENVEIVVRPSVSIEVIDVPAEALPAIPRNVTIQQTDIGLTKMRWEAPIRSNYSGFEFQANDEPIVKLADNIREYSYRSNQRFKVVNFKIRSYNDRGTSNWVEIDSIVVGYPDQVMNGSIVAGNRAIRVTFDPLPTTPLSQPRDPTNPAYGHLLGGLPLYEPQFVFIEGLGYTIYDVESPFYFDADNGVPYEIKLGSAIRGPFGDITAMEVALTATVTPGEPDPPITLGAVDGLALTAGSGSLAATWDALSGADYYEVNYSPLIPTADAENIADRALRNKYLFPPFRVDGTSFSFGNLVSGTEYTISVRGVNNNGTFGLIFGYNATADIHVRGDYASATGTPT